MSKNTASKVADQIGIYHKNIVDMLGKIQQLMESNDPSIKFNLTDTNGLSTTFTVPSFGYMQSEMQRLSNNLNSLFAIDEAGAMIKTDGSNTWKKVVTIDLNKEPRDIQEISAVSSFTIKDNWFLDKMMNPAMFIDLDLSNQIDNGTNKCLIRRYIVNFEKADDGSYTTNGQAAVASFSTKFRNASNININDFLEWHQTTTGVVNPLFPISEESDYNLEPNTIKYDGLYTVIRIEEDNINKKLWYVLNTLDYRDLETGATKQLSVNDELIVNTDKSNTRYKIAEISLSSTEPLIRVERIEGNYPIPVGIGTLKLYSPVLYTKKLRINIGYDERCVVFVKAINGNNNIVGKNWSFGMGFWTNDLKLSANNTDNGLTLEEYYAENVSDFGAAIKDIVARRIPSKLAGMPNAPELITDNFKVVQINKHLTDNTDSKKLAELVSQQTTLKSEISQLNAAIESKNNQLKNTVFNSDADRNQFDNDLKQIIQRKESKSTLLASVVSDILELSKSNNSVSAKYRIRGFWDIPAAVTTSGTFPQEVIQFEYSYRYLSKDGKETPLETYNLDGTTAVYSNWTPYKTDARLRKFNSETGEYQWVISDVSSADTPNVNQLEIAIQPNEIVEIRIRSLSEVGWPEAPILSEWSNTISIEFPDDLTNVLNDTDYILQEASKEDLKVSIMNDLAARGINTLLDQKVVIGNNTYLLSAESILSGFKDINGNEIDLFAKLTEMQNRIVALEEAIKLTKGELEVTIYRNNVPRIVSNGSEITYAIECEDYLDPYQDSKNRSYENKIYVIKDFYLKIRNKSVDSPLGLLSSRVYKSIDNSDAYSQAAPQVMWVNDQNELLFSNATGSTLTQLDNQFLWSVNYDSVNQSNSVRLSENIGNAFTTTNNNSLTRILGSGEYNIGYLENSNLTFNSNNNSLMDPAKWIDKNISVASTNKLLSTVHPVVDDLNLITDKSSNMVKIINGGESNDINIPINIYFKLNALDTSKPGLNNTFVNFANALNTVRQTRKIKFLMENESENRTFSFVIKFNLNRTKIITRKFLTAQQMETIKNSSSVQYKINK